jgi:hypothetical protein
MCGEGKYLNSVPALADEFGHERAGDGAIGPATAGA